MVSKADILDVLRRQPFYERVRKGDYTEKGGGPCKVFSTEVVEVLREELPEIRTIIIQNDNICDAGGEPMVMPFVPVRDHAYVAAFTPELGLFLIDPSAGQFLQKRSGRQMQPYDEIFIGKRSELLKTMLGHGMTESEVLRTWSLSATPYPGRVSLPTLEASTLSAMATDEDAPFVITRPARDWHELVARQAFRLEQQGIDWCAILFDHKERSPNVPVVAAWLHFMRQENSAEAAPSQDDVERQAYREARRQLSKARGEIFDGEAIERDLAAILVKGGEALDQARLSMGAELGRLNLRGYYRDAHELLARAEGEQHPVCDDEIRRLESLKIAIIPPIMDAAYDVLERANNAMLRRRAELEIGNLSRTLPHLPREKAVEARLRHLTGMYAHHKTHEETARAIVQDFRAVGITLPGGPLSPGNRFALSLNRLAAA